MMVQGPSSWRGPPVAPSGGGGDNSDMEARLAKLEAIIPTLATREDLARLETKVHESINAQTWRFVTWMTGICTALVGAVYYIARNVH